MNLLKTKTGTNKMHNPFKVMLPVLALATLLFGACLDDDDSYNDGQTIAAAIASINASPSNEGYDFYTDANSLVNTGTDFKYGDQLWYKNFYSGNREFTILKAGTNSDPVLDSVLAISNGQFQTLFLAGSSNNLGFVLLNDGNLEKASEGKVKVRFINLSPDANELNLGIKDASGLIASAKKFKEFTDFQEVDAGSLKLDLTNADGEVLKEITLDAQDGNLYTIYSKGLLTPQNPAFGIDLDVVDHYGLARGY